jgi:hypothetical protein
MVGIQEGRYQIKEAYQYGRWLAVGLVFLATIFIPYMVATDRQTYPDLNLLLNFYSIAAFLWIIFPFDFMTVTVEIETTADGFWMRKMGRKMRWYSYEAIVAHNERPNSSKMESFDELTVYLTDNWFVLRSNEYRDYTDLKAVFTSYGEPVRHRNVVTVPERNLIRWLIGGTTLLIIANIAFGFLAHNETDDTPAQLATITDTVLEAREDRAKGRLKGVMISLRAFPDFSFYVSKRHYDVSLEPLKRAILPGQPITITIRDSDFRKKLTQTEPLTFGDKYSDFRVISVFTVEQTDRFRLVSPSPVYELKRTNPTIRSFLLGFLLLLCWTVWVFVDRHRVLRAT